MDCIALRRARTHVGSFGRMKMDCIALARCTHTGPADPAWSVSAARFASAVQVRYWWETNQGNELSCRKAMLARRFGKFVSRPPATPRAPAATNIARPVCHSPPPGRGLSRRDSRFYGTNSVGLATTWPGAEQARQSFLRNELGWASHDLHGAENVATIVFAGRTRWGAPQPKRPG